jgi:hypothetical protein
LNRVAISSLPSEAEPTLHEPVCLLSMTKHAIFKIKISNSETKLFLDIRTNLVIRLKSGAEKSIGFLLTSSMV